MNGFDHRTAVEDADRHRPFAANVQQILREDDRLRGDEADLAFGRYLRRQTRWVTPDEAAYDAYRWWTPAVEPTVVLAREAEQLAHARTHLHDIASKSPDPELAGDDTDRPRRSPSKSTSTPPSPRWLSSVGRGSGTDSPATTPNWSGNCGRSWTSRRCGTRSPRTTNPSGSTWSRLCDPNPSDRATTGTT
jgi:hypothetical protein